jgi:lipopolysaccharide/colanic/teichoic acid biosynthesis glycosyltransferase
VKRALDVTGAALLLVVTSPLLAVIAVVLFVTQGRPVVFAHTRPGLHGRPFRLYKFRTMRDARDGDGRLLPDAERITRIGRFLRSTSLDELPELVNVLKGDMSLVGPRPLLLAYLDRYTETQARRHEVKPGITGMAQVEGRNALTWEERFEHDVWYVDHASVWLDLRILGRTFAMVLRREGISHPAHATMPEFRGDGTQPERS